MARIIVGASLPLMDRPLRLAVITDLHLSVTREGTEAAAFHNVYEIDLAPRRVRRLLARVEDAAVDAIVVLGDLTHAGRPADLAFALDLLKACCTKPLLLVTGNHDCEESAVALEDAVKAGQRAGDAVAVVSSGYLDGYCVPMAGVDITVTDAGTTACLVRLPAIDSKQSAVVILSHYPLVSREASVSAAGLPYAGDLIGLEACADLQRERTPVIVICGHLHILDAIAEGAVLQLACPAVVEFPFGITIVEIDPRRLSVAYDVIYDTSETGDSPPTRDPRLAPARACWRFAESRWMPA